jgi:hypothetical protein
MLNVEEIIRMQRNLVGLQFHVEPTDTGFQVVFVKIAAWQLTELRNKLFEFRMKHIVAIGKEVVEEPKPHIMKKKRKKRRRGHRPGDSIRIQGPQG